MRFLVLGAGALGSVFAGFLARDGHDVIVLGRREHVDAINTRRLTISGIWGQHCVGGPRLRGYTTLEEIARQESREFDWALLTVKSYDTREMVAHYLRVFPEPFPVVSLQNGLGNVEFVAEKLGRVTVVGGRVIFGAEMVEAGSVKVTVCADKVLLGGLEGGIEHGIVEDLALQFDHAGIPCGATREIEKCLWGKVLYNGALNGLGCLLEVNYGRLLESDATQKLMKLLVEEMYLVIKAKGLRLECEDPESYIGVLFARLIPATKDHIPSMLQDIRRSKRTEIDAMNGAFVRIGEEMSLPLPLNGLISRLVRSKEFFGARGGEDCVSPGSGG
jgi:2-dehydropantoate 2-reductase